MQVLFLAITLGLVAVLQAHDPLPFALEDVTGTWYVKAMVANEGLLKEMWLKEVSPVVLEVLDGRHLEASFTFMKRDQCHEVTIVMQSTGEPRTFSISEGKRRVYMEPLRVKDYYALYCEGRRDGRELWLGKLLAGRSPDLNPEALEEFKKFTQSRGLSSEDVFLPAQTERCLPESG